MQDMHGDGRKASPHPAAGREDWALQEEIDRGNSIVQAEEKISKLITRVEELRHKTRGEGRTLSS
jgi:hypothetical protein